MKKILVSIMLFFIFISNANASVSSASEYILLEQKTGRILEGKNYNTPLLIASITKIMTAVIAIESGKLDKELTVDDTILKAYGSGVYIEIGEKMTLRDLLYGLMLRSGNDAALMIAKYTSGSVSKFVEQMNKKANELGMINTKFVNPSGLDNEDGGNYSTAYDMAILTRYAMENKDYREITKTKGYKLQTNKKTYIWKNKNKLLNYDYITGGKTGYTDKARRTLVSTASKNNIDLIVVTLKDSDDWNTHKSLYEKAYSEYKLYKFQDKNKLNIKDKNKYKGKLYLKKDVVLPVKEAELNNMSSKIKLLSISKKKNNSKVGEYQIYLDKVMIYKEDIYLKRKTKTNSKKKSYLFDKIKENFT